MITNLYILGDSLSDSGGFALALSEIFGNTKKIEMGFPYYQGSFSNGPLASKILANKLEIKLAPGYYFKTPTNRMANLVGNNYAIAGAQITKRNKGIFHRLLLNHLTLEAQAQALLTHHTLQSNDLIFISIGGNDLIYSLTFSEHHEQEEIINKAIRIEKATIKKLIHHGAKKILISNVPDLSSVPRYINDPRNKTIATLTKQFNEKLLAVVKSLQKEYPNYLKYFDLFTTFKVLTEQFKVNKDANVKNGYYVGSLDYLKIIREHKITIHMSQNQDNIKDYLYFDDIHPSAWAHQKIANSLFASMMCWFKETEINDLYQ